MKLKVKKIHDDSVLPSRAHKGDAGIDLYAYGDHSIPKLGSIVIPTGVILEMQEGYVGLVWDKSSVGLRGVKTLGGVIDATYRGEVKIIVRNFSEEIQTFTHGSKVAQILIQPVELCEIEEVQDVSGTDRGEGGFGSTGR